MDVEQDQDPWVVGVCEYCGQTKPVCSTIDPYQEDVHGVVVFVTICENCYEQACDDI